MKLDYKPPGKVAKAFMKDGSFVRGIRGPVGSGKLFNMPPVLRHNISAQLVPSDRTQ